MIKTINTSKKLIAAGIIEVAGKFFIAKRKKNSSFEGLWEFPGGKMEEGESLQECLQRELWEELGITVEVGEFFCKSDFVYNLVNYEMHTFKIKSFTGQIQLKVHEQYAWVPANDLSTYSYPEADKPVVTKLVKENKF